VDTEIANAFLLSQLNQLRAAQGLAAAQVPLITPAQVAPNLVGGYGQTLRNLTNQRAEDRSVPPAVAGGCAVRARHVCRGYNPPATAGGTDLLSQQ